MGSPLAARSTAVRDIGLDAIPSRPHPPSCLVALDVSLLRKIFPARLLPDDLSVLEHHRGLTGRRSLPARAFAGPAQGCIGTRQIRVAKLPGRFPTMNTHHLPPSASSTGVRSELSYSFQSSARSRCTSPKLCHSLEQMQNNQWVQHVVASARDPVVGLKLIHHAARLQGNGATLSGIVIPDGRFLTTSPMPNRTVHLVSGHEASGWPAPRFRHSGAGRQHDASASPNASATT